MLILIQATFSFLVAASAHAGRKTAAVEVAPTPERCPSYDPVNDPWSLNVRITYDGRKRCLDLTTSRPAHRVSSAEIARELQKAREAEASARVAFLESVQPGETVVANVSCKGRMWLALIPASRSANRIIAHEEIFPTGLGAQPDAINDQYGLVGHAQNRFPMNQKVKLFPQRRDDTSDALEITDLVSSDEAVVAPPDTYSPADGQKGHFGMARRFTCLEDKVEDMVVKQKHKVVQGTVKNQVKLKNPQRTIAPEDFPHEVLMSALRLAEKDYQLSKKTGKPIMYKTLPFNDSEEDSCITGFFDTYDELVDYPLFNRPSRHFKRTPSGIFRHLYERGLLDWNPLKREPTLAEEFGIKI